jgi:hypothetical protein
MGALVAVGQDPALAASGVIVDSAGDANAADGVLTLREAILLANGGTGGNGTQTGLGRVLDAGEADNVSGTPGSGSSDVITFDAVVFPAAAPVPHSCAGDVRWRRAIDGNDGLIDACSGIAGPCLEVVSDGMRWLAPVHRLRDRYQGRRGRLTRRPGNVFFDNAIRIG